ncbi:Syntaxin-17 [Frankliniella fusca]|uniref:Syntaxin-17 n=1 Tax=Frankliniella fusca TaxID=407009 RepID=A0AAE1H1V4_9NEOP|nr:Syntaxin-17 [Frankliniella fusca]
MAEQHSPTSKKRPFKIFEHSISQFNDVVIPHRLDMLKKHKSNIEKAIHSWDYPSAEKEQSSAKLLIQNLARDLSDIEALRNQVDVQDILKFDKAIENSRSKARMAMEEYLCVVEKLLSTEKRCNTPMADHGTVDLKSAPQLQLLEEKSPVLNKEEEEYVQSWERLHNDIQDLHEVYSILHSLTEAQGEVVNNIDDNVSAATENVHQGNLNLKRALKYKSAMYPLMGAAVGTLVGGPVGLLIGLKAGGCAAVGGGLLGFFGGRILKKSQANKISDSTETYPPIGEDSAKLHQS